jgi:hypothetical protein
LNGIKHVSGFSEISSNPQLKDLSGLDNLMSVNHFRIYNNTALESLDGLDNLHQCRGMFEVLRNPLLNDLTALKTLDTIGIRLDIVENNALSNLSGLDNIQLTHESPMLMVEGNPLLSECSVWGICSYLRSHPDETSIMNNKTGCNTLPEVLTGCDSLGLDENNMTPPFSVFPNPCGKQLCIKLAEASVPGLLQLMDVNGRTLLTSTIDNPITCMDISGYPRAFYLLRFSNEKQVVFSRIIFQ